MALFRSTLTGLCLTLLAGIASGAGATGTAPDIPRFVEETESAGLQSRFEGEEEYMVGGGVAAFDCDDDGLPDLYVTAGVGKARLYRNRSQRRQALRMQEHRSGLETTNAIGAYPLDIDGDGITDLVVLRVGSVQVYRGQGQCQFERSNEAWGIQTGNDWHTAMAATWERGQRWPTLAIGTYTDRSKPDFPWGTCTPTLFFRPRTEGGYPPAQTLTPGHCALSMLFSDWNRSGTVSLRISNDREYYKGGEEQLWRIPPGAAPQRFGPADGWKPLQIWGMGIASHDLNGDGYPDVYLTSMSDNKLQVLEDGPAQPRYKDIAFKRGVTAHRPYVGGDVRPSTAWHAQFADLNNDGRSDLFVVKGNVSSMPDFAALDPNNVLLQTADGQFVEAGHTAGLASVLRGRGGLVVDFNGDGLLDVVVVNRGDRAQLWRQLPLPSPQTAHWLQLRLRQADGNRDAVGAWVEVRSNPPEGSAVQRQELTVGGGHASGHLGWVHFGLGSAQKAEVRVQWPHGDWSAWQPVEADRFYTFDPSGATLWRAP